MIVITNSHTRKDVYMKFTRAHLFVLLGFLATAGVTAYATHDGDYYAVVGDYYGAAGYITFDQNGNIAPNPIPDANSPDQIQWGSYGIGLGDFDNDGLVDYINGGVNYDYYYYYNYPVRIEFHKKTGPGSSFAPGVALNNTHNSYYYVMDFAVADYNEDGNLDFAVNDYSNNKAHVYLGNGNGTFQNPTTYSVPFYSIGMDAHDVNGDGHADFVAMEYYNYNYYYYYYNNTTNMEVFLGDGNGNFTHSTVSLSVNANYYYYYYYYQYTWGITLADFDGDGKTDVVQNNQNSYYNGNNALRFYKGNGDGTFNPTPVYTGVNLNAYYYYYDYASLDNDDFNHDGKMDILSSSLYNNTVTVYFGNGDGTFTVSPQGPVSTNLYYYTTGVSTLPFGSAHVNHPPVANAGDDQTVYTSANDTQCVADATFDGSQSSDPDGDELSYDWTWANGFSTDVSFTSSFGLGTTEVTLTVSDGEESASDSASVTVVDATAPVVTASSNVLTLWPPNGKYETVQLSSCIAQIVDNCGGTLSVNTSASITSVTSDEPEDAVGNGDGNTKNDIVIVNATSVQVRKERAGGANGRVYTVYYEVVDGSGNYSEGSCEVSVPHNQGGSVAVNDGPVYSVSL